MQLILLYFVRKANMSPFLLVLAFCPLFCSTSFVSILITTRFVPSWGI